MSISYLKIYACSIFICEIQNKKFLSILLKNNSKKKYTLYQYFIILLFINLYKQKKIHIDKILYKLLYNYINIYEKKIYTYFLF